MNFSVQVLGSNSAIPTLTRNPSAHLLKADERLFLIDCAEGPQVQLRRFHAHFQRIRHIFISHLHGDHFYGLIGLLTTFHLLGRKDELHVYAHTALKEIIDLQLKASRTTLIYPLVFHSLEMIAGCWSLVSGKQQPVTSSQQPVTSNQQPATSTLIYQDDAISVYAFPLLHSIPTCGFLFTEKPLPRKIRKDMAEKLRIPIEWMARLKAGEDYTDTDGRKVRNSDLTLDPPAPRSYAYCTDTAFTESILPNIQGVNLLYHEATFLNDMAGPAREKLHSTAAEAATIAKLAGVKKLLIGHFSARYDDPSLLLNEAREIFPETELAEDGKVIDIK